MLIGVELHGGQREKVSVFEHKRQGYDKRGFAVPCGKISRHGVICA